LLMVRAIRACRALNASWPDAGLPIPPAGQARAGREAPGLDALAGYLVYRPSGPPAGHRLGWQAQPDRGGRVGAIRVHEFISLDGVIDTPSWTFEYGYDPRMGEAIARCTDRSDGILLGRTTYQMFEPAWSARTAEEDP